MKYTGKILLDLVKVQKINNEVIEGAIKSIYEYIEEKDYATACQCYKVLVVVSYNCLSEAYIDEYITIGNILLSKELLDDQCDTVYYGLAQVYFMMHFGPKVLEYSMKYINNNSQKQYKELFSIYNNLSIVLKESNFFDKSLECCDICYNLINDINDADKSFVSLIIENNYCFILLKQNNYNEAIKHKKNIENILLNNSDNPSIKMIATSAKFTMLFVDLYTGEQVNTINEYVQIMKELKANENLGLGVKQSLEPHLEFITSLINHNMFEEAKEISMFIIDCIFFAGDFTTLYKILIDTNKAHQGFLTDSELQSVTVKYIKELEILDKNHKNVLAVLIQEQYRLEDLSKEFIEIKNKYQIDELTKCYNRLYLEQNGQKYVSSHRQGTLIFIDIDHFKKFNDNYGHHFGDLVLQRFVQKVKKCNKPEVNFYRYAGDEFIIITPYLENFSEYLDLLIKEFELEESILDKKIIITFSYGIIQYNEEKNNLYDLIEVADKLMYEMKNGKENK